MQEFIRILTPDDIGLITEFEEARLRQKNLGELERDLVRWEAPWRPECLKHYLATGWSVGLWTDYQQAEFLGYFLGQAMLYFKGLTQALWVESLSGKDPRSEEILRDTAVRLSRDKHLQSVFIEGNEFKTTKR